MDIIKDMNNLKIYSEKIDKYDVFYTLEKTSYPYYILSKIEVYEDNVLLLEVTADVRDYDGHTMGAEYKKIDVLSNTFKRTIEINLTNTIVKDTIIGNKNEMLYYERKIFKKDIYIFFYDKNIQFHIPINESKKRKILPRFKRRENRKY